MASGTFELDLYPQTWVFGGGTQRIQFDMDTLTGDVGPVAIETATVGSDLVAVFFELLTAGARITEVELDVTWDVTGGLGTQMFIIGDEPFQFQRGKTTPPPGLSGSLAASAAASMFGDVGSVPIVGPSEVSCKFFNNVTSTTIHTTAGHVAVSWTSGRGWWLGVAGWG
jgi:hypothetical protein